jgi:hypothetical protein
MHITSHACAHKNIYLPCRHVHAEIKSRTGSLLHSLFSHTTTHGVAGVDSGPFVEQQRRRRHRLFGWAVVSRGVEGGPVYLQYLAQRARGKQTVNDPMLGSY